MNKASGCDGIPAELFKILKDDTVKELHSVRQQTWKIQQWHRTGKDQFSFQSQRRTMPQNVQPTTYLHSFHMLARSCSTILQVRFQQFVNQELPDVQAGFRNDRGTRDNQRSNYQHPLDLRERKRIPEKHLPLLQRIC